MVIDLSEPEGKIVTYEPSMAGDVAEMFNKFKESWPGGFGGGVPFEEERIRDRLDESSAFVNFIAVDDEGVPVGFCDLLPHWRDPEAAYVGLLGVIQSVKGKKYGKRMLLRSIEKAVEEGIDRVDLHTWSGNLDAMPLYKKVGLFWIPDTSVYMQDHVPLLLKNDLTKDWFDDHQDWYSCQVRELKQEPDELEIDGMEVFRYEFQEDGDRLEAEIDRYGWGLTGVRKKLGEDEISIQAKLDSHEIFMGIDNRYVLEIENDTDEDLEFDFDMDPFDGLEFMDDFPSSVTVEKDETEKISRKFLVNEKAETFESSHKRSETIQLEVDMGEKEFTLTTGGKIKPAVEVDSQRDMDLVFDCNEKEIYLDLKNHTDMVLDGKIDFEIGDEKGTTEFALDRKETGGFRLPLEVTFDDEDIEYLKLTPSIRKGDDRFVMETYAHPLVRDTDGLSVAVEKDDEVHLMNNELRARMDLEGGKVEIIEGTRGSELPFELSEQVGPPFGQSMDRTLKFDHEIVRDEDGVECVLEAESHNRPELSIKKHVKIRPHSDEIEVWVELENVAEEEQEGGLKLKTRKWSFVNNAYQSKAKIYTPLGDEIVESEPVSDMLSNTLVPMDPDDWEETWTAYEDMGDGTVSGFIWDKKSLKKIKLWNGMLEELKSVTEELEPGETVEMLHLWTSVKKSSINSLRDTWNRLVGKVDMHPNERVFGKTRREDMEVKLDDNILERGTSQKRKLIVEKAVDYPMPGEYTLNFSGDLNGSFAEGEKVEISEEEDLEQLEMNVELDVSDDIERSVDSFTLHFSGGLERDFEIPVMLVDDGEVEVGSKKVDGEELLHVDNGVLEFDVMDGFSGSLIDLKDKEGTTYLDDNFPEPEAKSYFENHVGGIELRLVTSDVMDSFYEIEEVSSEAYNEGRWKGVRVDLTVEKLDALRGQRFSIRYLTLPGTDIVKIVLIHRNPKERQLEWLGELFVDAMIDGSLEDMKVTSSGKYENWDRLHGTPQFSSPLNVEDPWFFFEKGEDSLCCFAVKDSPGFSMVLCNDEVNMGFLVTDLTSGAFERDKVEFGVMINGSKDDIEKIREALGSSGILED